MVAYSKRFRSIRADVLEATRRLVVAKPWGKDRTEQERLAVEWIEAAAAAYRERPPAFAFAPAPCLGYYRSDLDLVVLDDAGAFSVTTLLHEFRHSMQHRGRGPIGEDDARAWSLSLFRAAAPRRFERMVAAGRILLEEGSR